MYFAEQLITHHIVTGFPEQRLAYLSERILACSAQYCAVLKSGSFVLLGIIRFSDIAANPGTATRILSDLKSKPSRHKVYDSDPVDKVIDVLVTYDPPEIVVEGASGAFVGLITPESFTRWLLASGPSLEFALSRLPASSRWNPYPGCLEQMNVGA